MSNRRFNIRVYGICINEHDEILLSREHYRGLSFVKFPGGGLEWGEGTKDCLIREFQEEFGLEITVGEPPSITATQELVVPKSIPITFPIISTVIFSVPLT